MIADYAKKIKNYRGLVQQAKDGVMLEYEVPGEIDTIALETPHDFIEKSLQEYVGREVEIQVTLTIKIKEDE